MFLELVILKQKNVYSVSLSKRESTLNSKQLYSTLKITLCRIMPVTEELIEEMHNI